MIPDVTPLGLLVLLAFFFVVALAFTVWAALTVGDAAKRAQLRREQLPAGAAGRATDTGRAARSGRRTSKRAAEEPPREPKPWERKPSPEPASAVQGSLWEYRPDLGKDRSGRTAKKDRSEQTAKNERPEQTGGARQEQSGRAVVKPREPNTDAFERFLESEKRRE